MNTIKGSWFTEVRTILVLAIPLIISNVSMIAMEVVDTLMAGQASKEDLAGLAIGGNLWIVIEMTMGGMLSAITPRIARFLGAKRHRDIKEDTQQALMLGVLVGVAAMLLLFAVVPYLPALGATEEVTIIAQGYSQVIALSLPVSGVCWVLLCMLEGHGIMRFVVISSLVAVILNIIFDYIFVFGKFGFPALGGVGCAWTTTIIYWLWGFSCIIYTARHKLIKTYKLFNHWPKIDWLRWRAILALGLPISFSLLAEEGFFNFTALLIAPLGTDILGAHHITIQVVSLVLMLGLGIGQATAICVARSIGESQPYRMNYHVKYGLAIITFIALIVGNTIFFFRIELPELFTNHSVIALISSSILMLAPIYLLIDGLQVWASQTLRGFEDTKIPMVLQIISYWLIGFPLAYSLGVTTFWGENYGIYGFWIGIFSGITIACMLLSLRLYLKVKSFNRLQQDLNQ